MAATLSDRAVVIRAWLRDSVDPQNPAHRAKVAECLKVVYANQTADEKAVGDTRYLNGVGFNGRDAAFLTSVAENAAKYGGLTPNQARVAARMLAKYARQIDAGLPRE
jgi:hypothetical protein